MTNTHKKTSVAPLSLALLNYGVPKPIPHWSFILKVGAGCVMFPLCDLSLVCEQSRRQSSSTVRRAETWRQSCSHKPERRRRRTHQMKKTELHDVWSWGVNILSAEPHTRARTHTPASWSQSCIEVRAAAAACCFWFCAPWTGLTRRSRCVLQML